MNKVLVVGNGFDLCGGLDTSYSGFLSSQQFAQFSKSGFLSHCLKESSALELWVDVEVFLIQYAQCLAGNFAAVPKNVREIFEPIRQDRRHSDAAKTQFPQEFVGLKKTLRDYLMSVDVSADIKFSTAVDVCFRDSNSLKKFDSILNFNYTRSTISKIFSDQVECPDVLHIHGAIESDDIVFGVQDNSISPEFSFLNKSNHASYGIFPSLKLVASTASEMHFYGLSFGETDESHFRPLFDFLSSEDAHISNSDLATGQPIRIWTRRKLFFYVYGRDGYINTRNRLMHLTSGKFSELKLLNQVVFFDSSDASLKKIDQSWINQKKV